MIKSCPNRASKEWKDLESYVGPMEAMRDFMETGGLIRTPEEVMEKLRTKWKIPVNIFKKLSPEDQLKRFKEDQSNYYIRESDALDRINNIQRHYEDLKIGYEFMETEGDTVSLHADILPGSQETYDYMFQKASEADALLRLSSGEEVFFQRDTIDSVQNQAIQDEIELYKKNQESFDTLQLSNPWIMDMIKQPVNLTANQLSNTEAIDATKQMAEELSSSLGVPYQMISSQEAVRITASAKNPWTGEAGFFFEGRIYFVGDKLTKDTLFHEFSHPLVRSINLNNESLFDNLYTKLLNTPEGQTIIQRVTSLYPELTIDSTSFKEEVITTAIGESANNPKEESTGFLKFIKDLMFAIKQMFRKAFGTKVKIETLSPSTTILELSKMLKGDKFNVEVSAVPQEEIAAYLRATEKGISELEAAEKSVVVESVNKLYGMMSAHLSQLQKDDNYQAMFDILKDEIEEGGNLSEIKRNLGKYQTMLNDKITKRKDDIEMTRARIEAFLNSIGSLDLLSQRVRDEALKVSKDMDNVANLNTLFYFDRLVTGWKAFTEEATTALTNEGIDPKSETLTTLAQVTARLNQTRSIINKVYNKGTSEIIRTQLEPMGKRIDEKYQGLIKHLEDQKAKRGGKSTHIDSLINGYKVEYSKLRLTPEKIQALLNGELGDAGQLNSFMEGYLYNQDPIIAGFAMFVNNSMTDVMIKAQERLNQFSAELEPLLKAAGYNPNDVAKLGRLLTYQDRKGFVDEEGNLIEKKIITFLNPHIDYQYALDEYDYKVKQAKDKYLETNTEEDHKAYFDILREQRKHIRDFFHQPYKDEFYIAEDLLLQDDIGVEAKDRRDEVLDKIQLLSSRQIGLDEEENTEELDQLWQDYRQLFSLIDLNGNRKSGREAEIAERLREHRDLTREFYTWEERKNIFQQDYINYTQSLINKGFDPGTVEYESERKNWIEANTRVKIKDEFYAYRNYLLTQLKDLLSELPGSKEDEQQIADAYSDIFDSMTGFKDEDGQVTASEIPQGRMDLIKSRQEQLIKIRSKWAGFSGLTTEEAQYVSDYFEQIESFKAGEGPKVTQEQRERVNELLAKKSKLGLSKTTKEQVGVIMAKLNAMQSKEPTDDYLDIMNNYLEKMDTTQFEKITGTKLATKTSVDHMLKDKRVLNKLFEQSEEFKDWFMKNHVKKKMFSYEAMDEITVWERVMAWSITKPTDKAYYESTDLFDDTGEVTETINRIPNYKYFKRVVKGIRSSESRELDKYLAKQKQGQLSASDEKRLNELKAKQNGPNFFRKRIETSIDPETGEYIIGTVDNLGRNGRWLPKLGTKQGAPDNRYVNKDFFDMEKNSPAAFNLLKAMTKYHLQNQALVDPNKRLYMAIPRYRMDKSLERIRAQNPIKTHLKNAKDFFLKAKDDWEQGYKMKEDDTIILQEELFSSEEKDMSIPMSGLSDLDLDQVSLDLTQSLSKYMLAAEKNKKLTEINPVARALQEVMKDPKTGVHKAVVDITKVNKLNMTARNIVNALTKQGTNVRAKTIDNIIEREFQGITNAGITKDLKWLNQSSSLIFNRASFGFFAFNIPSALKNSFGQMFQTAIESAGGEHLTPKTYAKGIGWASKVMPIVSMEIYKKGPKSMPVQLLEIFDPALDRFANMYGESMSRTTLSDTTSLSWLYNTRKWVELHATLSAFAGMMYKVKVKIKDASGEREISYLDAWEIKDGQVTLKAGVDPEWGTNGSKFKAVRNNVHEVGRRLNGAYDKFNQPEAQRYLVFRFFSYLNRYFITMLMNRWGFRGKAWDPTPRYNIGSGDVHLGWYMSVIKTTLQAIRFGGKNLPLMTKTEKSAFLRVFAEVGGLVATSLLMRLLFGWDPDDDDRYDKLRSKSGHLPFPFAPEDPDNPFNAFGYLENHSLNLLMQIRAENEQWLPVPYMGLDDYKRKTDLSSIAFGPTIDTYVNMTQDLWNTASGDPSASYKRDVGPYLWQRQGGSKFLAHFAKTWGLTGSSVDPVMAIKNFQSVQARTK